MRTILFITALFMSTLLSAQKPVEIPLWPNGAPNTNGITTDEQEPEKNRISNVTVPTLTIYPATQPNGLAIIMCPGGGYTRLAMDHEGHDMAQWFNTQGITYAVLKYRMPNGHSDIPLSDAHQAIRLMREHAKEWNFTKLGIMGASAGGHLASTAATHYTAETRPDFQILLYPVVSMNPTLTHKGSHDNLLGKNPSKESEALYSNELQVKADTPPAFIIHSSNDEAVPVANSINYYMELIKNKIPASLHTYPIGGHGWGFHDSFPYKRQWTEELEQWLKEEMEKRGFTNYEMAKRAGIHQTTIAGWLDGKKPQREKIDMIKAAFAEFDEKSPLVHADERALDEELVSRLTSLTPEDRKKVDAFVQGLLANR